MEVGAKSDRLDHLRRVGCHRQRVDALVPPVRRRKDRALRRAGQTERVCRPTAEKQRAGCEREQPLHTDGRVTTTRVPSPSWLSNVIVPPCCSTSAREIASPRPVPGIARRVAVDARKKRENTCPCSWIGTPMPVSLTM